jgi:outer membrane lipoprotein SlyB
MFQQPMLIIAPINASELQCDSLKITVREDDGSMRADVQQVQQVQQVQEDEVFRVGERVRIATVDGTSRVLH